MELLKIVNKINKYTLQEIIDNNIVIIIRSKIDLAILMNTAIDKNTIKAFDGVRVWNEYVADTSKNYDGKIAVEVIKNNNKKNYEYKFSYGWVGYFNKSEYRKKYNIVEYCDGIITDWRI
jgi:hypothetical protein